MQIQFYATETRSHAMARRYFTLVSQDRETRMWGIEFGDYDRDCVVQECRDMRDSRRYDDDKPRLYKIIATENARQSTIDAAMVKLNSGIN